MNLYALPAIIALLTKIGLLSAARFSSLRTRESNLFTALLFALATQNAAEVALFNYDGPTTGVISLIPGFVYFGASILFLGLLLHLVLVMCAGGESPGRRWLVAIYAPAIFLELSLWLTPWLVEGFVPIRFTYTRVPGPLYPLFTIYVLACFGLAFWTLARNSLFGAQRSLRRKSRIVLLAVMPMTLLAMLVVTLQSFGINVISTPLYFAICVTFFIFVMAYAIYDIRLFSISFPIGWKMTSSRRTSFHNSLRQLVSEIDDLSSNDDVLGRIATLFGRPVAIVAAEKCVGSPDAGDILAMPVNSLSSFSEITVAADLEGAGGHAPALKTVMNSHKVGAVVPFRTHANQSPAWLLFGTGDVHAGPLDFDLVEDLCQKLGERFLESLTLMRESSGSTATKLQDIEQQVTTLTARLMSLEDDNAALKQVADEANSVDDDASRVDEAFSALDQGETLDKLLASYETKLIEEALRRCNGNKARAARTLGLRPNTLHYRLNRYGIETRKDADASDGERD